MSIWSRLCSWWIHRRHLREVRNSVGTLLKRADDHLLEDIGLTRQDLRNLTEQWDD